MELEAAYSRKRARRGANFSGIIWKGGDVITVKGYGIRKLASGDLHAVARVAGEAYYGAVNDLAPGFWQRKLG